MRQRVQHLAAETLGDDTSADALARRVDRRGRATGRATADDQHVVRLALSASFAASRSAEPLSTLARISASSMRPVPKGWPFR